MHLDALQRVTPGNAGRIQWVFPTIHRRVQHRASSARIASILIQRFFGRSSLGEGRGGHRGVGMAINRRSVSPVGGDAIMGGCPCLLRIGHPSQVIQVGQGSGNGSIKYSQCQEI